MLKASPAELERHYVSQVTVTPLALDAKNHYIDSQKGTQLDVSHDFRRGGFGREPLVVKGTSIDIAIPFTGNPALWRIQPSSYSLSGYPKLEIRDDVVVFAAAFRTIRRSRSVSRERSRGRSAPWPVPFQPLQETLKTTTAKHHGQYEQLLNESFRRQKMP